MKTSIKIDKKHLRWPSPAEMEDDSGLGGNLSYYRVGKLPWREIEEIMRWEEELVNELDAAEDPNDVMDDDERDIEFAEMLGGLDPGVTGAVLCLAAVGCVPFASCNGGVFGDTHHETHPLVVFFCKAAHVDPLIDAAKAAGIGLESEEGHVMAYAGDIRLIMKFAHAIVERKGRFGHP